MTIFLQNYMNLDIIKINWLILYSKRMFRF